MNPELQPGPKKWPLSPKKTLLLVAGAVALIIIVITIVLMVKGNGTQQPTDAQAVYHDRPGYDRNKLGDGVADPFAVTFTKTQTPVTYQSNKVIQACNLLRVEDITEQGMYLKANTLTTPISRAFNDGVGKAPYSDKLFASSLTGSSLGRDVNNCHYVLEAPDGTPSITINAFQPFATPIAAVNEAIERDFTPAESVEGLEVFTATSPASGPGEDTTEYIVRQGNGEGFYLALALPSQDASKKSSLLRTAVKNFIREQKTPTGPSKVAYKSPIYPKSFVSACELITNEHVRTLSGRDAGPLAYEGIPTSIGILKFNTQNDKTPYPYISNECKRGTTGGGSGLGSDGPGDFDLTVETTSFLDATPAKLGIEAQRQKNPNNRENIPLSEQIGDGAVAYTDTSNGFHVIFYKGRIAVDISINQFAQRTSGITSLSSAAQKLTPIAKSMANKITDNK